MSTDKTTPKTILVIEDNTDVRENIAEILELSNYQVITAENGKIGVQQALDKQPDLILCDVMMPELDGFGVLHILAKKPATASIPFIFLTAKTEKSDMRKGMNLGADDYITKPFDDVELLDAIEMRLKKSERIRTAFTPAGPEGLSSFINEARGQEALSELSQNRERRHFRKKEIIFEEGAFPKSLFFIESGRLKTYKTNEDGRDYIVEIHREGEFLGYLPLLQNERYAESAAALEDVTLGIIPKDDFFKLLYSNKDVSTQFIKMLANNLVDKEEQLLNLAYNSVRKRVADALLKLKERFEEEGKGANITMLRDDLASMVGTAKETVIRTLTDFRTEGLIDIAGSHIRVLRPDKLKNMPN